MVPYAFDRSTYTAMVGLGDFGVGGFSVGVDVVYDSLECHGASRVGSERVLSW